LAGDGTYHGGYNSIPNGGQYHAELRKTQVKAIGKELAAEFNRTYTSLKFFNLDMDKKGRAKY